MELRETALITNFTRRFTAEVKVTPRLGLSLAVEIKFDVLQDQACFLLLTMQRSATNEDIIIGQNMYC